MTGRFWPIASTARVRLADPQIRRPLTAAEINEPSALIDPKAEVQRSRFRTEKQTFNGSEQNQALLELNQPPRRAAAARLRVQQTVEGLSLAAILYYLVGLVAYVAEALKAEGVGLQPDVVTGIVVVPLAVLLVWTLRRARSRLGDG